MLPASYAPYAYALFRIVFGLLFMLHGLQKLFGLFGGRATDDPLRFAAGLIEVFGGALLVAGLFVRPVAFIASGEMAVAYFLSHAPQGFWPIENGGELAALYSFAFLYVSARGAGIWSAGSLRIMR
jgi:putative oxidoreductase